MILKILYFYYFICAKNQSAWNRYKFHVPVWAVKPPCELPKEVIHGWLASESHLCSNQCRLMQGAPNLELRSHTCWAASIHIFSCFTSSAEETRQKHSNSHIMTTFIQKINQSNELTTFALIFWSLNYWTSHLLEKHTQ